MKKIFYLAVIITLAVVMSEYTFFAPFDTGMTTFKQPNGVEFTGRIWGDEFFWWSETEDGYRFIQSGDGWYYYAQLDENGEFTKTEYNSELMIHLLKHITWSEQKQELMR